MRVKVMESNRKMFGSGTCTMIGRNFNATAVIFKNSAVHFRGRAVESETSISKFIH